MSLASLLSGKHLRESYQLLQVVLYRVWVNHNADSNQSIESKVKYLVAEKWDDPGSTQLKQRYLIFRVFRKGWYIYLRAENQAEPFNQTQWTSIPKLGHKEITVCFNWWNRTGSTWVSHVCKDCRNRRCACVYSREDDYNKGCVISTLMQCLIHLVLICRIVSV